MLIMNELKIETNHGLAQRAAAKLDTLGASLSFACALHCALQPLLLALLPLLGMGFLLDEKLETVFLGFSILLAGSTVISGWRHHRQPQALPVLGLAAMLIVFSRVPAFEHLEVPMAVSGALGIMSSHLYNLRLHRRFHKHAPAEHSHGRQTHLTESLPVMSETLLA